MSEAHEGGCACGAVRFRAQGEPLRAGICHCRTCQQVHGAAFYAFAVFHVDAVQLTGETRRWQSTPRYTRLACAVCGARLGGAIGDDLELALPLFDDPAAITPKYESWVSRRLPWVAPLAVPQYEQDRPGHAG